MQAQQALRRTMEKYVKTCRLILLSTTISKVLPPLRSRCVPIRVPAPTQQEVIQHLSEINRKEKADASEALLKDIAQKCNRNLRRAILMFEGSIIQNVEDNQGLIPDYIRFIDEIAMLIMSEQSPKNLIRIRGKLFELLKNCIPPSVIMRILTEALLRRLDDEIKHETVKWAAHYEHSMQRGSKPIFHLEAFVARFMALYKKWVIDSFCIIY